MIANQQYNKAVAITPSDSVNFIAQGTSDNLCSAIYVGGAGVVVVVFQDGSTANFTCVAGQILPVRAKRVNSTSTTATLMLALYSV
jgi:hypothetical protein